MSTMEVQRTDFAVTNISEIGSRMGVLRWYGSDSLRKGAGRDR